MSELKIVDLKLFHFLLYFIFFYFELRIRSYHDVTQCHTSVIYHKTLSRIIVIYHIEHHKKFQNNKHIIYMAFRIS